MTQLRDDCFATDEPIMLLAAALAEIERRVACVVGSETVPVFEAAGRVLAEDVAAPIALPPFANSAVDGYAVRYADLAPGADTLLPVAARLTAGLPPASEPQAGAAAVRIFTGAAVPPGFDTVFMQEDVTRAPDGRVLLPPGLKAGDNRRLAGEDIAVGAPALAAGRRLRAADLALLGALGLAAVAVRTRLRVAVFSTGNEVRDPGGGPLGHGQVYDANRPLLIGLLATLGCRITNLGILPDRRDAVASALGDAALQHDLLITSGGVSMGEEDHVRDALAAIGRLAFWRVAVKPGRPVALGTIGACAFAGLPGNPVAAFVTFVTLVRPLLARLGGERYALPCPMPVEADFAYRKREGRREYVRVSLWRDGTRVLARKHPREGAGMLTSLTETDGLVVLPEDQTSVAPGDTVSFLAYAALA